MATIDLYIVAAGSGSRMSSHTPKALIRIVDEPCLTATLQQIGDRFRRVFVITATSMSDQWAAYFQSLRVVYPELAQSVVNVSIRSGLGDGHATLQGILSAEEQEGSALAQEIVVAWGDVFFPDAAIIDELLSRPRKGSGLLPAVDEPHPYVCLRVNEDMQCLSAEFSKYGEQHSAGFHDQSVFRFDRRRLRASLFELHNALWKNGRYIAPGSELSLLYSFHQLYNAQDPAYVYETNYPTLSFNTVEEVAAIQVAIRARWRARFRNAIAVDEPASEK
jgi:molybdopterin-guanine dinucleotide biosynthesis protein A